MEGTLPNFTGTSPGKFIEGGYRTSPGLLEVSSVKECHQMSLGYTEISSTKTIAETNVLGRLRVSSAKRVAERL